jgi:very-short-patch-repair endonuclease
MRLTEAQAKAILGKHYKPPKIEKSKNRPKVEFQKQPSVGEAELMLQLRANHITYKPEFKFCEHRRWRADFLILGTRILVEVEGGTWSGGRHTRGKGYEQDCEKYSWAAAHGWTVLRFTTEQVNDLTAIGNILVAIRNIS